MSGIYCLASYPKSGNTWLRSMLTNYWHEADEPVSINELEAGGITTNRELFDEITGIESSDLRSDEVEYYFPQFVRDIASGENPLYVKVHNAYTCNSAGEALFPKNVIRGVVYLIRNPLDIAISYAHHANKAVDDIIELMACETHGLGVAKDRIDEQLPVTLRSWNSHVASWTNEPGLNIHVVRYEDMLAAPAPIFTKIAGFIGIEVDKSKIQKAIKFSTFKSLQAQEAKQGFREKQPTATSFFRRGEARCWRTGLNKKQIERVLDNHWQMMARFGYLEELTNDGCTHAYSQA